MTNQIKMGETYKNTKIRKIGQHIFCDVLFSQANIICTKLLKEIMIVHNAYCSQTNVNSKGRNFTVIAGSLQMGPFHNTYRKLLLHLIPSILRLSLDVYISIAFFSNFV